MLLGLRETAGLQADRHPDAGSAELVIIPDRRFDEPGFDSEAWNSGESNAAAAFRALRLREEYEPIRAKPGDVVFVAPSGRGRLASLLRADGLATLASESSGSILRDSRNAGIVFPWTLDELAEKRIDFAALIGRPERFENLFAAVDFMVARCEKAVIVSFDRPELKSELVARGFRKFNFGRGSVLLRTTTKYELRKVEK